ncbi:MATE family efflux transporter [Flaviaesturariibacter aridisoli]|uniref:Multidrug-efflux transporter n=2 Tax=Flaviaesturariibacter aridisoli TaxID=2545761 RepID=A0A4R4E3C8_9BACT|nr:MATE family efflux transporter [Flaviaesturariibacter aridisoli]
MAPPDTSRASTFTIIRRAVLKGEQQDFTQGSLRRAVVLLAIPMIIEMIMESIFALVDLFFVSKLGKHAVSTVGLTESVLTLVYSLGMGGSMAATALVARRVGEKNPKAAANTAMQAILAGLLLSLVMSITGIIFAPDILHLLKAEPETIAMGTAYTRTMMASSTAIILLFLINGIFRGAGDASLAMKSLTLANVCNIILCPILILGWGPIPAQGLFGAALATTIGRSIGVLYQLAHLFRGKGVIRLSKAAVVAEWSLIRNLLSVAWPAALQFLIGSCSWIFLARLVAETGGSTASAGYMTAIRLLVFFILPAWGISNAAATLVGQNLGAQNPARAEAAVWKTVQYNAVFMLGVTLLFELAARPLIGFFAQDPAVIEVGVRALRIVSAAYLFYGAGMVFTNALNGAGDTRTPTWINVFGFWLFQIPLAWLLAKGFDLGPTGVFVAIPVSETLITLASFYFFKKGKWKQVVV